MRFCPKCGREDERLYDGLCEECFGEEITLFTHPKRIEIKICPSCGGSFHRKWKRYEEGVFSSIIEDRIRMHEDAENVKIEISEIKHPMETKLFLTNVEIRASAWIKGLQIQQKSQMEIFFKREMCKRCSRISGGYYEAIVQIRAENRFPSEMECTRSERIAREVLERDEDFISKVKRLREGLDIYVGSIKGARKVSKAIVEEMGGSVRESPRLHGRKDGRNIYRISFSVRLPSFGKGDIVELGDRVLLMEGTERGIDLSTGSEIFLDQKGKREAKKICGREDAKKSILTMVSDNEIQILDPDTFAPLLIEKPSFLRKEGGVEISVVKTRKGIFVLP
ncbi:MAG: 60S ribosomal export protein NMD3 [Candidatus Syntropharchaeia archaeon]